MSLINVNSPLDYQSIRGGSKVQYEINCERVIPLKSSFVIWVEYSDTPDFKNLTLLEVTDDLPTAKFGNTSSFHLVPSLSSWVTAMVPSFLKPSV